MRPTQTSQCATKVCENWRFSDALLAFNGQLRRNVQPSAHSSNDENKKAREDEDRSEKDNDSELRRERQCERKQYEKCVR